MLAPPSQHSAAKSVHAIAVADPSQELGRFERFLLETGASKLEPADYERLQAAFEAAGERVALLGSPMRLVSGRAGFYHTNTEDTGIPFFDVIHNYSTLSIPGYLENHGDDIPAEWQQNEDDAENDDHDRGGDGPER